MPGTHDDHMHDDHAPDGGLEIDLPRFVNRRSAFRMIAGIGLVTIAACRNEGGDATATDAPLQTDTATATGDCAEIPDETAGPFPADGSQGSNAPNILEESGVVRSDITKSIGSASGVAEGVPLTVTLTVVNVNDGCRPYEGAAVYLWHCTREGGYSMYSQEVAGENFLRGVQAADADGKLSFTTIFPGCYSGRWPHMHFEVYPDVDAAAAATGKLATSQLALPQDSCEAAYQADGYDTSVQNLANLSLDRDNVFSDGYSAQLAKTSGSNADGWTAELTVAV